MLMKKTIISLIILFISFNLFSAEGNDVGKTTIDKTSIKIGEKITISNELFNIKDVKILWKDVTLSSDKGEIISYKDYYKANSLFLDVVVTFFEAGEYDNFYVTIPIVNSDNETLYFYSKETTISVIELLTAEEKANIEKAEQIPPDLLKPEKDIAPFNFNIKPYIWIIVLVIALIAIIIISIILIRKFSKRKKGPVIEKVKKSEPYEEFLSTIRGIEFNDSDERIVMETKLSLLSEALRGLINEEFLSGAYSETTRELIYSLRKINFDATLTNEINRIFNKLDMIKFAKAHVILDELNGYLSEIKKLGLDINDLYKQSIAENQANFPKN